MGAISEDGVTFESVLFPEEFAEISYTEENDNANGVVIVKTIIIPGRACCPDEWDHAIEALQSLVDAAQLALRSPPDVIPFRG